MRAVSLMAVLCLAACSSIAPTSNLNPNAAPRTAVRHADSNGIAFDLRSYLGVAVATNVNSKIIAQTCIASITPNDFTIRGGEYRNISIVAHDQGTCKDASRKAEFVVTSISFLGIFVGVLHVTYAPTPDTWTAKFEMSDPKAKLCSDPPGIEKGIQIKNNGNVALKFC